MKRKLYKGIYANGTIKNIGCATNTNWIDYYDDDSNSYSYSNDNSISINKSNTKISHSHARRLESFAYKYTKSCIFSKSYLYTKKLESFEYKCIKPYASEGYLYKADRSKFICGTCDKKCYNPE